MNAHQGSVTPGPPAVTYKPGAHARLRLRPTQKRPAHNAAGGHSHNQAGHPLLHEHELLDVSDSPGDVDVAWAGVDAVEHRAAAPHALALVQHGQPLVGAMVTA